MNTTTYHSTIKIEAFVLKPSTYKKYLKYLT